MARKGPSGQDDTAGPAPREAIGNLDEAAAAARAGLDATMAAPPSLAQASTAGETALDATLAGPDSIGASRTLGENEPSVVERPRSTGEPTASRASALIRSGTARLAGTRDDDQLPIVDDANYERLEELARGGLGRIVKARDRRTGRIVALKEMLRDGDDTARRFRREARITALLEHPSIVPVYELGRWLDHKPFFAMKLVAGQSLQDLAASLTTLPERLARLDVIAAVADALAYAHGHRVIHRDLKPANVLVGEFGETVVIDWGLAKLIDEDDAPASDEPAPRSSAAVIEAGSIGERTMDGSVLGTPSYMAPEQALGNRADQRSDVYAIGAMAYHLITGVTPYTDRKPKDVAELLVMVERTRPTPVATLAPGAPPDLVTIIEKAMSPDRSERYPSARELAEELRRFSNGQLVRAHDYGWRTLARRWLARHRATVVVAAALVGVLIVGAIYSVRSIIVERDAARAGRVEAETARGLATDQTRRARASLATALVQKGRSAEQQQRWADAAMYYAASRVQSDTPKARWLGGLAEAKAIVAHARHEGHQAPVTAAAISRDGNRVITVDTGGHARLWSRADGRLIAATQLAAPLWSVAISPDDKELAIGDDAGTIHRLTVRLEPIATLAGHRKRVWSLAYAPDGTLLASGGEDATARLWPVAGGAPKILKGHTQRVYSVSFSPDGKRLASGSDDRTLWLWSVDTGTGTLRGAQENGGIRAVEFTRDGSAIAAGGWDFDLKLWPTAGGPPAGWNDRLSVHDIAVSPDARVLISAGDTGELRFWEVSTRNLITTIDLPGGRTSSVVMSQDGRWLVTAGDNKVPVVWDIGALPRLVDAVGHRNNIAELSITSDGTRIATVADDYTLRLWNLADGHEQLQITLPVERGKRTYCSTPRVSKVGVISSACEDRSIHRWDLAGRVLPPIPTSVYLRIASLAPDDVTLAAGHMKGVLATFDIAAGKQLREKTLHDHQIYGVSWGATGLLATASLDNTVKVWTPALELLHRFRIDGDDGALRTVLSPDGRIVVGASQDGTLYAWELASERMLGKHRAHDGPIWGLAYAADQRAVYSTGEDGRLVIWDPATWSVVGTLEPHEGNGGPLALSPDGKIAVTGYRNGALIAWDLAARRIRYRLGGNARDFGSCDEMSQQRWVDDAHRRIVEAGCSEAPATYFDRIRTFAHKKIENDVDVAPDWDAR